jgi:hypothetical protein
MKTEDAVEKIEQVSDEYVLPILLMNGWYCNQKSSK